MSRSSPSRRAGILVPLFSLSSSRGWGIGEIPDIPPFARWLESAGQRVLQLLPINEMAPGQQSPYSAISAMAIDPIFITVPSVPEFAALGATRTYLQVLDLHDFEHLELLAELIEPEH